ncbi:anaphase-promoting complex subunit cdc27, partial [Podochytrium sp. JEL0797]
MNVSAALAAFETSIASGFFTNAAFVAARIANNSSDARSASSAYVLSAHALLLASEARSARALLVSTLLVLDTNTSNKLATAARFLLARACLSLGQTKEAEDALKVVFQQPPSNHLNPEPIGDELEGANENLNPAEDVYSECLEKYCPDESALHCLMGLIYKKSSAYSLAQKYLTQALELNPYLWVAFEALSEMGAEMSPQKFFTESASAKFLHSITPHATQPTTENNQHPSSDFATKMMVDEPAAVTAAPVTSILGPTTRRGRQPPAPTTARDTKRTKLTSTTATNTSTIASRTASNTTATSAVPHPAPKHKSLIPTPSVALPAATAPSTAFPLIPCPILESISLLARARYSFKQYRCRDTIAFLHALNPVEAQTAGVAELVGRSYFEMAEYRKAEEWFQKCRNLEPHHISGMDIYSSTLWHLRKEVPLSHLAHQLEETARLSPETWCAIGNCF